MRTIEERIAGGRLTIDLGALASNWHRLAAKSAPAECAAVVKANAYGLGIEHAVPALVEAGCRTFFVALLDEAIRVRASAPDATIYVLNGVFGEALDIYRAHGIRPVIGSIEDARLLAATGPLAAALHIDTGMTRLGLSVAEAEWLACDDLRGALDLQLIMTHYACADDLNHPKTDRQFLAFEMIADAFPGVRRSVGNSAATFAGGDHRTDLTRPGVALYGGEALNNVPNGSAPVVTLEGRIVQLREAEAGETVGYGGTVTLTRRTKIAIVSVGYADGFPRAAGGGVPMRAVAAAAHGWIAGTNVPLLGRVSMDLTAYDVTDVPSVAQGDWVEMFGPHVPIDDVARAAGTIGYELLTGLGTRFARTYIPAS